MKTLFNILTCQVILFSLISCDGNHPTNTERDSKVTAESHNDAKFNSPEEEKDAQYLVEAYSNNLFEIELSKHAKEKAMRKEVQNFAGEIILSDVRMNEEIKNLADKKQVSLQQGLTDEQLEKIKKYGDKRGIEFDQSYLGKLAECRQKMIKEAEEGAEETKNPEIHNLFDSALPELRKHLDDALTMKDHIK